MRRLALLVLVAALVAGCGKKGPPVAPERRAPQPASGLSAVVVDGAIEVEWANPTLRADGTRLRDLAVVRVFRTEDDGSGEPRPALVAGHRVPGYTPVAEIALGNLAAAPAGSVVLPGGRFQISDRGGLVPDRRYTYVIVSEDTQGRTGLPSARLSLRYLVPPAPPSAPEVEAGDRQVHLRWGPPPALVDGSPVRGTLSYEVLRGLAQDGPLAVVTPTPLSGTDWIDGGLENDRPYRYAVRALRRDADSLARGASTAALTATPADTTPPAPPTDLVAIPSPASVFLSWTPSRDADVAAYVVYRAGADGVFVRIGSTRAPLVTFTDRDVPRGTYVYVVKAQDTAARANESRASNEARVSVP